MTKSELRKIIKDEIEKLVSIKKEESQKSVMDILYEKQVNEGIKNGTSGYTIYGDIIPIIGVLK